ncbi:MAG: aldo/keto reductase, partial [Rickettsiales bacterium]
MKAKISKLGFGLSSIAGSGNFKHQQRLIKYSIECGITHFDVAPYYGHGDAEKILGDVLSTCYDEVTITTKFGLMPFNGGKTGKILRKTFRPLFRKFRLLKGVISSVVRHTHNPVVSNFSANDIISSIDRSIQNLRRPVDIFLLHDVSSEIATNFLIVNSMNEIKKMGKALAIG